VETQSSLDTRWMLWLLRYLRRAVSHGIGRFKMGGVFVMESTINKDNQRITSAWGVGVGKFSWL
jgi:hypothetical protein